MDCMDITGDVDDKNPFQQFVVDVVNGAYPFWFPKIDLRRAVIDMIVQTHKHSAAAVYASQDAPSPTLEFDQRGVTLHMHGRWPCEIQYESLGGRGAYGVPADACVRGRGRCRDSEDGWCAHAPVFAEARLVVEEMRKLIDARLHGWNEHDEVHENCFACIQQRFLDIIDDRYAPWCDTCNFYGCSMCRRMRHNIDAVSFYRVDHGDYQRKWVCAYNHWKYTTTL